MNATTGAAAAGPRRIPHQGGRRRQPPKMMAEQVVPGARAGRKLAAAGLIGSAALAGTGLAATLAPVVNGNGTAPAGVQTASLTGDVQPLGSTGNAAATGNATNVNPSPTPTVPVGPAPQSRNGTPTFSGGVGVSLPFDPVNGFGLPNLFGTLFVTPPQPAAGSLPLNFNSSTLANLFSPSIPASSRLPASSLPPIFELDPTPQADLFTIDPGLKGLADGIAQQIQQQNAAAVQAAADQVGRSLQILDSIFPGGNDGARPTVSTNPAGQGTVQVASTDPFQAFADAASRSPAIADALTPQGQQGGTGAVTSPNLGDLVAQNAQAGSNPTFTLTYPDGSTQTFQMGPSGKLFAPFTLDGSTPLYIPPGTVLTTPGEAPFTFDTPGKYNVGPSDQAPGNVPVLVVPPQDLRMSDGTPGTTTGGAVVGGSATGAPSGSTGTDGTSATATAVASNGAPGSGAVVPADQGQPLVPADQPPAAAAAPAPVTADQPPVPAPVPVDQPPAAAPVPVDQPPAAAPVPADQPPAPAAAPDPVTADQQPPMVDVAANLPVGGSSGSGFG